jgi:hypothetical protein
VVVVAFARERRLVVRTGIGDAFAIRARVAGLEIRITAMAPYDPTEAGRIRVVILRRVLGVVVVLLAVASISFNRPRSFEFVDNAGAPLDPAYVAYSYSGSRPNFVHPVSYEASRPALARGDASGRIALPARFHVHRPFPLETHPSLRIELVYIPRLHNALVQIHEVVPSRPGVFEIDAGRTRATVFDLGAHPQLWEGTLRNVASLIHRLLARRPGEAPLRERDQATAALARELVGQMQSEYDAFLLRYRDVERSWPEMPAFVRAASAEEQGRWKEMVAADLAREPTWGPLIVRLFRDEVRSLRELESELR